MSESNVGKLFEPNDIEFDKFGQYEIREIQDMSTLDEIGGGGQTNYVACNIIKCGGGIDGDGE